MPRILIVGGYGTFGLLAAERLAHTPDYEIIIAGRNSSAAATAAQGLAQEARASLSSAVVDAETVSGDDIATLKPDVIINASGPFQAQNYHLARAAIAQRCHYIDLADSRAFVTGISRLDAAARQAGVLVVSGASSVPGLSSTVICHIARAFRTVDRISIAISPGNHFDPGIATIRSVLGGLGKPIATVRDGDAATVFGWQDLKRGDFGELGKRWLGNVDVPDLTLLPEKFPNIKCSEFQAGLEVGVQHFGLWMLSWLARIGVLPSPQVLAQPLSKAKHMLRFLGSDRGGMTINVTGVDHQNHNIERQWTLVAKNGHGPYVPTLASTILTKALIQGRLTEIGAKPCFDLFSYDDFQREVAGLSITCTTQQTMC